MISLLLQNSAGQMSVGLAQGDNLLFDSNVDVDLAGSRNVEAYVSAAFTHSGKMISDVGCVLRRGALVGWVPRAQRRLLPMPWASPKQSQ